MEKITGYDIVEKLAENFDEEKHAPMFIAALECLTDDLKATLIAGFSDCEVIFQNEEVLRKIQHLMFSSHKRLSQIATLCLIQSKKEYAIEAMGQSPYHYHLLLGLFKFPI